VRRNASIRTIHAFDANMKMNDGRSAQRMIFPLDQGTPLRSVHSDLARRAQGFRPRSHERLNQCASIGSLVRLRILNH